MLYTVLYFVLIFVVKLPETLLWGSYVKAKFNQTSVIAFIREKMML